MLYIAMAIYGLLAVFQWEGHDEDEVWLIRVSIAKIFHVTSTYNVFDIAIAIDTTIANYSYITITCSLN